MSYIAAGTGTGNAFVQTSDTTGNLVFQTNGTTTALTLNTSQNATLVGTLNAPNTFGFKNRIINGGMTIDQRNSGSSVTPTNGAYTLDRWKVGATQASKFTIQQNAGSVTPPGGFSKYLGVTSSSAYSIITSDEFTVFQPIEGQNVADLGWGTANAKAVTLSFQVYSSLTGTFGGAFNNSALDRVYPFSYSIPVANTWTTISIPIAGDTSGTWLTTNGVGIFVQFGLGVGSNSSKTAGSWQAGYAASATGATSVVGTNGATWYITGVQLETGTQATSFDFRDYGRELYLCQRYCLALGDGVTGVGRSTTQFLFTAYWTQIMRTAPAVTITDNSISLSDNYAQDFTSSGSTADLVQVSAYGGRISISGYTGLTQGRWYGAFNNTNGYFLLLTAEL